MIDEFLTAFEARLRELFGGWFHWLIEPLYLLEWYVLLALVLGVCLLLGYFFNFTWVRAVLGFAVAVAIAFVAGGTKMYRHMRREEEK